MNNRRGRPNKYLTVEQFEQFKNNDFYHLILKVSLNTILLKILIGALIAAALIDKLVK